MNSFKYPQVKGLKSCGTIPELSIEPNCTSSRVSVLKFAALLSFKESLHLLRKGLDRPQGFKSPTGTLHYHYNPSFVFLEQWWPAVMDWLDVEEW